MHLAKPRYPRLPDIAPDAGKLVAIEDRIFTEPRIRVYACVLAVAWAFIVGWLLSGGWITRSCNIDFCWEWVTGVLAVKDPAQVYDVGRFVGWPEGRFPYPPTLILFLYPLGWMPYAIAFAVWIIATLLLYEAAIYAILPRTAAVVAALTPVTVAGNTLLGHNGFLTAGLIGLSLVFLERRPWLSGIFLGALTYKPHFGILFPLALLSSRNWRALGSATLTAAMLNMTATIAFGYKGWTIFIDTMLDRNSGLSTINDVEQRHQSIYGLLHWAGTTAWISWTVHLAVASVVILAVCLVWAKPFPHSMKAAALSIGSVAVTPYVLPYDLCILSIAVAFLVSDGLARGFLPGERIAMLICFAGLFLLLPPVGPVGPFIDAILLILVVRRIVAYERGRLPSLRPVLRRVEMCAPDGDAARQGVNA